MPKSGDIIQPLIGIVSGATPHGLAQKEDRLNAAVLEKALKEQEEKTPFEPPAREGTAKVDDPAWWNQWFSQRPEAADAYRKKVKYKSTMKGQQQRQEDRLERKRRRYILMEELMKCSTQCKILVRGFFRYNVTQKYLWKVYEEAQAEGMLFADKLRSPGVYHRLQCIKAEITAGPYGSSFEGACEEVEDDMMDRMVVETDVIQGRSRDGDGWDVERKKVLDRRELAEVMDFGNMLKSQGNEAFETENYEAAMTRYCQGDELLKQFAAESHLKVENEQIKTLWRQTLNNKAMTALKLDEYNKALAASEDALRIKADDEKSLFRMAVALEGLGRTEAAQEILEEIEKLAEDRENKEEILKDVEERREMIADIEQRAAKDFSKMFKRMGDRDVFAGNRFLPDGTSPLPRVSDREQQRLDNLEKRLKLMGYLEEHQTLKDLPLQKLKDDDDTDDEEPAPPPPKPPRPKVERSVTLTKKQASSLLDELYAAYGEHDFQKKVHFAAKQTQFEMQPFLKALRRVAFEVQRPILEKWGFDPTEEGLKEMEWCLGDHTYDDEELAKRSQEALVLLYGGENGMWGNF